MIYVERKVKVKVKSHSRVRLFATPWTVAHQAPLTKGFSRHKYWSGLPFPSPGDHPNPGIEPGSPTLEADALTSEPPGKTSMIYERYTVYCLSPSEHAITAEIHKCPFNVQIFCWSVDYPFHNCCIVETFHISVGVTF